MDPEKNKPTSEQSQTHADPRIELTEDEYQLLASADLEDVDSLGILPEAAKENGRVIVSIRDNEGNTRTLVMLTGEDLGTTDRAATEALHAADLNQHEAQGGGNRLDTVADAGDSIGESVSTDDGVFDSFEQQGVEQGHHNSDAYKDALRKIKGEYAHITSNLVNELAGDVSKSLLSLNHKLETSIVGVRMLESGSQSLKELAFNTQMGTFDLNLVRQKLEQIAQTIGESSRKLTEGAELSRKLPEELIEGLVQPLTHTEQALRRADADYKEHLAYAASDNGLDDTPTESTDIETTEDMRNDIITASEMVQEWADMPDVSGKLEGGAKSIPALGYELAELLRASYSGRVDSYELQRVAALIDRTLKDIAIEEYAGKSRAYVNKIRNHMRRMTATEQDI